MDSKVWAMSAQALPPLGKWTWRKKSRGWSEASEERHRLITMPLAAHEAEASIAVLPGMSDPKLRGAPFAGLALEGAGEGLQL